jgi:phage-related tail protein
LHKYVNILISKYRNQTTIGEAVKTYRQLSEEYLRARDEVTNIKSMKSGVNSSLRRLAEELSDLTVREIAATIEARVTLEALMSHKEQ